MRGFLELVQLARQLGYFIVLDIQLCIDVDAEILQMSELLCNQLRNVLMHVVLLLHNFLHVLLCMQLGLTKVFNFVVHFVSESAQSTICLLLLFIQSP